MLSANRSGPGPQRTHLSEVLLAALVVGVVAMMILPLPTPLLDLLITCNMAAAVVLLLVSTYLTTPLRFATFPGVLLITTLFRLGLNVSTTRLILLQADAGRVIDSFGGFVVGSNLVVGAVIFLILTLIQFVVIARGSERVAEVAARFTLDALPGRQLAIDADQRSGALSLEQARAARARLQRESQLYGAMDGAMRFVKGDAIAGILITIVNIAGGLLIGVLQQGMDLAQAARIYSTLTIGDGLVSQIPALLISTAAGIVVTRVASVEAGDTHLGQDIGRQLTAHPRALALAAALMALLAVVPGLPALPFLLLAALLGGLSGWLLRRQRLARQQLRALEPAPRSAGDPPIVVELGPGLLSCADAGSRDGQLLQRLLRGLRELMLRELGVPLPAIQVRPGAGLDGRAYRLLVFEVPEARGELPHSGLSEPAREALERTTPHNSLRQVDAPTQICLHLGRVLRLRAAELVGIQETRDLLDQLQRSHPALVKEVVPARVSLPVLARVLQALLAEGVSIRDLRGVLRVLAEPGELPRDPLLLAERVRRGLGRAICHRHARADGSLPVYLLDPGLEELLQDALRPAGVGARLDLEPDLRDELLAAVRQRLERQPAVLLTRQELRPHLGRLLRAELPDLAVLSHGELTPELSVRSRGMIGVEG
jgi:type III secretion protein V